ncbi:MAG: glycosyltransferase family 39 protein [Candidatus Korobacteraceae bacterium]
MSKPKWGDFVCLVLLTMAVCLLFKTSPTQGDFWWSDAPRHAMDGAFYYDMARALPVSHLKQWAIDYYLQYPAVTALTYPPLFALVEAIFFSIFGVSHVTAQLTVAFFLLLTAFGTYFLVRRWMDRVTALATALLFIGTPVMALWGRQVMLEIPTFALLIWSCYFFFRYIDSSRTRNLYFAVVLVLAAADTKQPAIFILPAFLLTLYVVHKNRLFRLAEFWWSSVLFVAGIAPLVLYTWLWGRTNMQQAVGGGWVKHSRFSPATWSYIARFEWPRQLGWGVLALALAYCVGCALRKQWRPPKPVLFFLAAWLITGYAFFTLISVASQRYTIFLIFPIVVFSILVITRVLPPQIAPYAALVFAAGSFAYTLAAKPVPYVSGYRTAAQYVCSLAPQDSVVMFSGIRDGSFIFNVKSLPECKNLTVIRADKLLLKVAIHRDLFGVKEFGVTEVRFKEMLQHYSVHYIVIEPDFWPDLKSMQMLVALLHENQFKLLTKIPIVSNRERIQSELEIYENTGPMSQGGKNLLKVELPVSGISVEGTVGQNR